MAQSYQSIKRSQEIDSHAVRPDVRSLSSRLAASFRTTDGVLNFCIAVVSFALLFCWLPFSVEIAFIVLFWFYRTHVRSEKHLPVEKRKRHWNFPYRVPKHAGEMDGSYPKNKLGDGISFLGKEDESRLEIWESNSDMRTHRMVFGTTGSGKTELLLGIAYNALMLNSGCLYTDGKGDVNLITNIFRLCRYLGREDDLLCLNLITSGRDFLEKQTDRLTNTMNPFSMGSTGMVSELCVGLMDSGGSSGDMWKNRAISFLLALIKVLVFCRDRGYLLLDAETFINHFELEAVERIIRERKVRPTGSSQYVTMKDEPILEQVLAPLMSYVSTLPGYQKSAAIGKQGDKTLEQHGFITMQLVKMFNDLAFTYAHLFKTTLGEIEMYDVVLNRRVLVVLLPALERAPDTLAMLGKLIVGAIKQMMAGCLGNRVEGALREIVHARPTNSPVPYKVILDEYGYYAVQGFAVAPAQARSLSFSITFAAQDYPSLKKASPEEAAATWENTKIRIVGAMTGGHESETFKLISSVAGEALVYEQSGRERSVGTFSTKYRTGDQLGASRQSRLSWNDMARLADGEFLFLVGKKEDQKKGGVRMIFGRALYTQVTREDGRAFEHREQAINHFLKVEPPRDGDNDDAELIEELEAVLAKAVAEGRFAYHLPNLPDAPCVGQRGGIGLMHRMQEYVRFAMSEFRVPLSEASKIAVVAMAHNIEESNRAALQLLESAQTKQNAAAIHETSSPEAPPPEEENGLNARARIIDVAVVGDAVEQKTADDLELSLLDIPEAAVEGGDDLETAMARAEEDVEPIETAQTIEVFSYLSAEIEGESTLAEHIADLGVLLGDDPLSASIAAEQAVNDLDSITTYIKGETPPVAVDTPKFDALLDELAAAAGAQD